MTEIKYTLQFFRSSKLNEEACGDRPHPTPITQSIGELGDTYQEYWPQYQLILVYREVFSTDTLWNTTTVTKPENFQETL